MSLHAFWLLLAKITTLLIAARPASRLAEVCAALPTFSARPISS
jgi:hypothetical protein